MSPPASTRARRRPALSEERAARRAADREQMKEAIAALQTSEGWQRWLRARRHFHAYSLHNQLLIAHQCPDATRVAGFRAWLGLGYCVRKGERAIRIWAPLPPSKKALDAWREAGSHSEQKPRTHFRLVPVFDRSQVDPLPDHPGGPAPLEPPHEPISGDGLERLRLPLTEFAAGLDSEVSFERVPGSAAGYHEPATGRIVVDDGPDRSPNAEIQTLVHELAHLLICVDRREDDPKLSYRTEEVVVESVAYSVCAGLGLDTSGDSVPYLAGWGGEEATDQIERYAQLIDRLARRIEQACPCKSTQTDGDSLT
jgi:antirestriction protein ArdC